MGLAGPVRVTALQISGPGAKQRLSEQEVWGGVDGWMDGGMSESAGDPKCLCFLQPRVLLGFVHE